MIKKITNLAFSIAIVGSLLVPSNTYAKEKEISYEQVLQDLEKTKLDIQNATDLSLKEKEKISKETSKLVNEFLATDSDIEQEKIGEVIDSLKEIDGMMYDVVNEKGNENFGSKSVKFKKSNKEAEVGIAAVVEPGDGGGTYWNGKGDILISYVAKTYGFAHGHAAVLSTTRDYVIESLPSPGVVHQSASKYWSTVSDEGQYYVKGASDYDYIEAANYAKSQVGDPYKLTTTLNDTTQWYCSKLVYQAWKAAGWQVGSLDQYTGFVLPESISADWDTIKYKSNPY
jgi:uncharacterized protein YycO